MYKAIIRPVLWTIAIICFLSPVIRLFRGAAGQADIALVLLSFVLVGIIIWADLHRAHSRGERTP